MTKAMDAWNLISPHINPMENPEFNNDKMAEAFCLMYIACKEYDKNHKSDKR